MREMANDICKIDTAVGNGNRAEFSSIFRKEYARAVEPKMRGTATKPPSVVSAAPSKAPSNAPSHASSKANAARAAAQYRSSSTKKKSTTNSNIFSDSDSVSDSDTDIMT